MPLDFEALIGHLHIVGGRSISAQPPGMLVEVAPKRSARGRELDTFFALASPSGDVTAPPAFYEQLVSLSAERYFNSTGSVTAGLRTVFSSLNQDLVENNIGGKRHYEANLICAVLREDEIFLARVGSTVALIRTVEESRPFPTEFSNDEGIVGPPLGVQPVVDVKMTRHSIQQGDRLALSDLHLADLDYERLCASLASPEISNALSVIREMGASQLMMLLIEFVPPDMPSPPSVKEIRTSSRPSATPIVPLPQAAVAETSARTDSDPPPRIRGNLENALRRGAGQSTLAMGRAVGGVNTVLDKVLPPPVTGQRSWLRTSTATLITILIPVAIVVLVMVMGLGGTGQSEFELCVEEANKTANVARSIISSDVRGTLAAWNAVISVVDRCNDVRQGDPALTSLIREAQSVTDYLFQVERRDARLLDSFPNALLRQMVLQGLDLYVLDGQNELVYRITLGNDGRSLVPNSRIAVPVMRVGASVGEYRISRLVDIAWSNDDAQIVALDNTGTLIECSPRFLQSCQAQKLLGAERWVAPIAMTLWQSRLYLLDPAGNQIWRYDSSGGTYASAPIEYFSGQTRPDIRSAVDFGIDDKGSVYILNGNGQITKWVSGNQTPFAFAMFPEGQVLTSAQAMFLNNDPVGQGLFIVSQESRTIYETSLAGTFSHSYRTYNEDDFAGLSGIVADTNQQMMYVISGNSVFAVDKRSTSLP